MCSLLPFIRSSVALCAACQLLVAAASADDWPQWLGPKRDGVWRETGVVDKFPAGGPKVLWRKPVGAGYTGPAVTGGKVFLMDRVTPNGKASPKGSERVLCLDEKTG